MDKNLLDFEAPIEESASPLPIVILLENPADSFFYIRKMSQACLEILGLSPEKAKELKKEEWYKFLHPDDFQKIVQLTASVINDPKRKNEQVFFMMRVSRVGKRSYEWMGGYLKEGEPVEGIRSLYCVFFTSADIEFLDRQMWNDQLPGRLIIRDVLNNLETPVFWKDNRGKYIGANQSFLNYFGFTRDEIVGKSTSALNICADHEACLTLERQLLEGKINEIRQIAHVVQHGKIREVNLNYTPLKKEGKIIGLVGSFLDVTEANEAQRILEKLASFDYLTGIKNRRMYFQALEKAAKNYQAGGSDFAVLMLDLDSFKEINDTFGHDVGDQILVEFTHKASEALKGKGELYRLGGDEFITLIPFEEKEGILALKDEIQAQLTTTFDADGHELRVACSIGFAIYGDYLDTDILMREADRWMYRDKFLKKAKR